MSTDELGSTPDTIKNKIPNPVAFGKNRNGSSRSHQYAFTPFGSGILIDYRLIGIVGVNGASGALSVIHVADVVLIGLGAVVAWFV